MARLVIVTVAEEASGYRLAGCAVEVARPSAAEVESLLGRLTGDPEVGVVAIHEPLLDAMEPSVRRRFEDGVTPIMVPLPSGTAIAGREAHRARLAALLQRAIGYRIEFGEGRETER